MEHADDIAGSTTDGWRRALETFESLAALSEDARGAELERIRTDDPALHARLATLFDADLKAGGDFLTGSDAAGMAKRALAAHAVPDVDLAGRTLGPYEILREIGAGGMGRVWLAKRSDGHYEGQVAIKLLKASLADRGDRERFAREGRILGKLAHPNIARLLDAGTLEGGQLYLVLEYVEGTRIDDYCDAKGMDARARVQIFESVCEAVAYAHANLVVHRDLKPSNILVTAKGEVKLLDFGIAKLLVDEQGGAAETELTQLAGRALTPEYAAPEQVSGAPVTTATDVYSLGVVLYRLLTGRSPYRRDDGSLPSSFDLQREVLEAEPLRLGGALSGDLENIVAKALRKPPPERYSSAQALREDLVRFLEHRPVEARGDSAAYLVGRFVRRHRVAVVASVAVVIAVVAGVVGVARESVRAQAQADKAKAVSDFMTGIFNANNTANPDPIKARATTARELLDIGRQRAAKDLAGNPEALQEVQFLIGELYYGLGLREETAKLDRERVELMRSVDAGGLRLADALAVLAGTLSSMGDAPGSEKLAQEAIAIYEAKGGKERLYYAQAVSTMGNAQRYRDPREGAATQRRAVDLYATYHPNNKHYAYTLRSYAIALNELGDLRTAVTVIARAIEVGTKTLGPGHPDLAYLYQVSGVLNQGLLRLVAARADFEHAIEIDERVMGPMSTFRPNLEIGLARADSSSPQWREARKRLEAFMARIPEKGIHDPRTFQLIQAQLAQMYLREGDLQSARAAFAEVLPGARRVLSRQMLAAVVGGAAEAEIAAQRAASAGPLVDEFREVSSGGLAANRGVSARRAELETRALLLRGDSRGARELAAARFEELRKSAPPDPHPLEHAALRLALAEAEERSGSPAEAEARARELLAAVEKLPDREWFAEIESAAALRVGSALVASGKRGEALPYLERAVELRTARQHPKSPALAEARMRLADAKK